MKEKEREKERKVEESENRQKTGNWCEKEIGIEESGRKLKAKGNN